MPFHQPNAIKYYTFDLFNHLPITHAIFTRQGGVSKGQWSALNMGLSVGDNPEDVQRNKRLAFEAVGRDIRSFVDSWLVHGVDVMVYDEPLPSGHPDDVRADILLTDNPAVTLFMRYADCTPLLFYDPEHHAIALAHAGWRGTVQRVGQIAVEAMGRRYGTDPAKLLAAIGPAISAENYEVGQEVIDKAIEVFDTNAAKLLPRYGSSIHFDQWAANELVLKEAGVKQIALSGLCTAAHNEDWFSHRAEKGKTGRFGVLIGLNDK